MLDINLKQRPNAESVAKQLDMVLHYVVDKINNGQSSDLSDKGITA